MGINKKYSRREFLSTIGLTMSGLFIGTSGLARGLMDLHTGNVGTTKSKVAVTLADSYERELIKQKIQHLFDALGGIGDVVHSGDKVGIKINLTGGSSWANDLQLQGVDIRECAWTHPEVLRAVGELIIDNGVNPNDIYIVEAIWDMSSYSQFGYQSIQQYLGAQFINLNDDAPYSSFINVPTGSNYFFYSSFIMNRILEEVDVFISIPKMKQHYCAGVTHSMKNLIGSVPLQYYMMPTQQGTRSKLHIEGGNVGYHLPRSVCDLNMARPVHLAVIDGVKNARAGEGPWNPTFTPYEQNMLLAGKDPVATDSIASYVMGNDPEKAQLECPDGSICDNHLYLAHQKGMGTNILSEIELVGDGAGSVFGVDDDLQAAINNRIRFYPNNPNPFTSFTTFHFSIPRAGSVDLRVFNSLGQEVKTLVHGTMPSGEHKVEWRVNGLPSGIYHVRLSVDGIHLTQPVLHRSK
ncbi:MAG: DUF362 domain-containing protein [Bacteroidetes bacterium]|nr:DUF362 domain-containing protein [Bacteroidota bacterium]